MPENGYTVSYKRGVVHNAKIYIRPCQRCSRLDPEKQEVYKHANYAASCMNA